jgi:hypothetical protein
MIEKYDFGMILIEGKEYKKDILLFERSVFPDWWRKEGHHLYAADLEKLLALKPAVLVIGTGYDGIMEVDEDVADYCKKNKIKLVIQKTGDAVKTYDSLVGSKTGKESKKVAGAFHLTC